ncbi:MAG: globin family protein [Bacteroidota bacterium]
MDPKTISLVQTSFEKVIPIADTAMEIFYAKLFEINPALASLFPVDEEQMGKQRNKLRDMLVVAVKGLSNLDRLVPVLQNLGRRHVSYGVTDDHYTDVGAALLGTLEAGLGDDFTEEVRQAWTDVYGVMAQTMTEAARSQMA